MHPLADNLSAPVAVIAKGCEIQGSIRYRGSLQLDGQFNGSISVDSLTVGESGQCEAELACERLTVFGQFNGKAVCNELEVIRGASVSGEISYSRIRVEAASKVVGRLICTAGSAQGSSP